MSDNDVKMATRWIGFISGVLTIALGIIHIINFEAYLEWPSGFIHDVNKTSWRGLFTFTPHVIGTAWAPLIWGILAVLIHSVSFQCDFATRSFLRFLGLFIDIGYGGGLGIIFSVITWILCSMSLYCWLAFDDNASLQLQMGGILKRTS